MRTAADLFEAILALAEAEAEAVTDRRQKIADLAAEGLDLLERPRRARTYEVFRADGRAVNVTVPEDQE